MTAARPAKTRQGGAEGSGEASSDPLSLRSLRVGDEVVIVDPNRQPAHRRVVRIGRRYMYTSERCGGYDLDTGRDHGSYSNTHAYTLAAHERHLRVAVARRVFDDAYRLPEDRLLAIHDALKAAGLL